MRGCKIAPSSAYNRALDALDLCSSTGLNLHRIMYATTLPFDAGRSASSRQCKQATQSREHQYLELSELAKVARLRPIYGTETLSDFTFEAAKREKLTVASLPPLVCLVVPIQP